VNVAPSGWFNVFSEATNPLTSALTFAFDLPRDMPDEMRVLLRRIDR
jgi:hypothetical protein